MLVRRGFAILLSTIGAKKDAVRAKHLMGTPVDGGQRHGLLIDTEALAITTDEPLHWPELFFLQHVQLVYGTLELFSLSVLWRLWPAACRFWRDVAQHFDTNVGMG